MHRLKTKWLTMSVDYASQLEELQTKERTHEPLFPPTMRMFNLWFKSNEAAKVGPDIHRYILIKSKYSLNR